MPAQTSKAPSLFSMLSPEQIDIAKKTHAAVKNNEPTYGMIQLPSGIKGGIAQIVVVKAGKYASGTNKDKPYVMFSAAVVSPKEHNGIPVEGQRATITIPLCDTPERKNKVGEPKMFADNWDEMLDEFKKLGVNFAATTEKDVDTIITALDTQAKDPKQEKLFTRFSTRGWLPPKKKPTDPEPTEMVFVQFDGHCAPPAGLGDALAGTTDSSGPVPPPARPATTMAAPHKNGTAVKQPVAPPEPEEQQEFSEFGDISSLVSRSEEGDGEAQNALADLCREAGYDDNEIKLAKKWQDLADMASNPKEASEEGEEEQLENPWQVGNTCRYKPFDSKTKKPSTKAVDCEITTCDEEAQTVNLKNLSTKVAYKNVPWAKLEENS